MEREVVFVHVPKTGGASVLQICIRHGVRLIGHDLRNPNYISLAEYRKRKTGIYSFSIVRNPWDRVVSTYYFLKSGGIKQEDKEDAERFVTRYSCFDEFVLEAFRDNTILEQIHFRPQYKWISDDRGIITDQLGRFENLQIDCSRWFSMIGLPNYKLPHVNRSRHDLYKTYYTKQTQEIIRRIYSRDIQLFGYHY